MLKKLNAQGFDEIYRIMGKSFPKDEYRSYTEQKALLRNPLYSVYVINSGGSVKAFIAVCNINKNTGGNYEY